MQKLVIGFISLTGICFQGHTQGAMSPEFGLGAGIAIYQGDLSPHRFGSLKKADISFNLFSSFPVHPGLSIRAGYAFAALQESDKSYSFAYKPHRNFSFKTLVNEFSLQLIISPLTLVQPDEEPVVSPYLFAGAGFAFLRINRNWDGFNHGWPNWQKWVREGLAADSAHIMPGSTLTFPIGIGVRWQVGENFSLFAEASQRIAREEYLDGFSKACNPQKSDAFGTLTAGIIFQRTFNSNSLTKLPSY